ncbi:MAG: hypothetical protein U0807_08455 [Candidatus Binatia bacterium]
MTYQLGDYVYVADLPQRPLCRVAGTDGANSVDGPFQILTLEPVDEPWRYWPETRLIRLDGAVYPADADAVRRAHGAA